MHLPHRRRYCLPLLAGVAVVATGCLQYEADVSSDRTMVPVAVPDGTCQVFRPRADATMFFDGLEGVGPTNPSVTVWAYTLPPPGAPLLSGVVASSTGTVIWSGGQLRRGPGDAVKAGQLYGVQLSGLATPPIVLPGQPPATNPPWTVHVKLIVTAKDAAGKDVPLDCDRPPTPPPPGPMGNP